jgi:hypothetical protein
MTENCVRQSHGKTKQDVPFSNQLKNHGVAYMSQSGVEEKGSVTRQRRLPKSRTIFKKKGSI